MDGSEWEWTGRERREGREIASAATVKGGSASSKVPRVPRSPSAFPAVKQHMPASGVNKII